MPVPPRLRYEILRRDNSTCRYCGASAPDVKLQIDHVMPVALGGSNEPSNLVTACATCNRGKSSVPPDAPIVADVSEDAVRLARALTEVTAIRLREIQDRQEILDWFEEVWAGWHYGRDEKPVPAPEGFDSVIQFVEKGLSRFEIEHLVGVAMRAGHIPPTKTWAYFCGCCWKRIRDNVDMAAEMMAAEVNDGAA